MMCTILWLTHKVCIAFIILKYYLFNNNGLLQMINTFDIFYYSHKYLSLFIFIKSSFILHFFYCNCINETYQKRTGSTKHIFNMIYDL
jgi:hypothetical protein